ncbi:ROK family protein [Halomonas dongshanensis]|uniref:ROK family protein n=1 Tax=Halomonas dongshanensis TaxID=2890835 RepID=A0ABT2EA81_9GAMM|nr:ROK family protein [Halomonas dongshanensis]MCS2608485.1 ROK family protein [Halomonas dongshanensis]
MKHNIGIDVGGTKIEGIILFNDVIVYKKRIKTQANLGYNKVLSNISKMYFMLIEYIEASDHTLGIGTPGSLMKDTGALKNCNVSVMNNKKIKMDIESTLNREVVIENDANCFVLAEAIHSEQWKTTTIFGAVLGTGCGAGIVVNGKLIEGRNQLSGEWGHMSIHQNGLKCYCGRNGCAERYISGRGVEDIYESMTGKRISMEMIIEGYRQGKEYEKQVVEDFLDDVSFSLANIISIIDPHLIIVGGGLSSIDIVLQQLPERVSLMINRPQNMFNIQTALLGDSAGSIGAAIRGATTEIEE